MHAIFIAAFGEHFMNDRNERVRPQIVEQFAKLDIFFKCRNAASQHRHAAGLRLDDSFAKSLLPGKI